MNVYFKREQEMRSDLRKLNKEKMTNRQYSLYRCSGSDLFSKADENRRMIMKHNLTTTSPLLDFFDFNPWGLDAILDEDLIRPESAPNDQEMDEQREEEEIRPKTAGVIAGNVMSPMALKPNDSTLASTLETRLAEPHVAKVEYLLRSQSAHTEHRGNNDNDTNRPVTVLDHADDIEVDGEVDVNTERTRARKITINAEKFGKLQKGEVNVKLRDKDGKFILKPISMDYIPDSVESVFIAKDPSKERMALVRQNTSKITPTVSSELKVNNRIAIQRSLMGKAAKKTSVAEIFKGARDRKTRHFRIFLKHPAGEEDDQNVEPGRKQSIAQNNSSTMQMYKHQKKMSVNPTKPSQNNQFPEVRKVSDSSDKSRRDGQKVIAFKENATGGRNNLSVSITSRPQAQEILSPTTPTQQPSGGILLKRRCDSSASSVRPPSQLSVGNNEVFSTSGNYRVLFPKRPNPDLPDSRNNTPGLNRSASSMSMNNNNVQFMFSDQDMTDMIQKLVEGRSEDGDRSDRAPSNLSATGAIRTIQMVKKFSSVFRKRNTPTPSTISADTENTMNTMRAHSRIRNARDAKEIIRNVMKQDEENMMAMSSMRRRVALGAHGQKRPSTVASIR